MISVLIPVYNTKPAHLKECVLSCLYQTIDNYEIVIVDNGSDNLATLNILKEFEKQEKIRLFSCPRQQGKKNLSVALNYGLQRCKFDLVARMDSDDIMCHDRLEKQKKFLDNNSNIDIVGGQIKIFPTGIKSKHPHVVDKDVALRSFWFLNHPTVMYRRHKIISVGSYKEEPVLFAEDYELWLKCIRNNLKIRNIQDVVVLYRMHENNLSKLTETNPNYINMLKQEQQKLKEAYDDID